MKIISVSEYKLVHEGLQSMLKDKYSNIDIYFSLVEALEQTDYEKLNLLIYTVFKENKEEIDEIVVLKNKYPNVKVLIIDFIGSNNLFFKFSKLKIEGYILGTFVKEDIEYAIHKISQGNRFYDRELLYKLVDEDNISKEVEVKGISSSLLTNREGEILCQLAKGLSNFEIACNLNISENTVKKHVSNIFMKINVKDRTQATIYAYDMKLV